ncbi:hypothetical protein ACTXT7_004451 [Hymenolepis weldensis]
MPTKKTVGFMDVVRGVEIMKAKEKEVESHSIQSLNPKSKPLDVKELHTPMRDIEEEKLFNQSRRSESQYSMCANTVIQNPSQLYVPTLQPFEEESIQFSDSSMLNGLNDSPLLASTPLIISRLNTSEDATGKPLDISSFNDSTPAVCIPLNVNRLNFSELSTSTLLILSCLNDTEPPTSATFNISAFDDSELAACIPSDVSGSNSSYHSIIPRSHLSDINWEAKVKEALAGFKMPQMEMTIGGQSELSAVRRNLVSLKEKLRSTIRAIDQLTLRNSRTLDSDGDATTIAESLPSKYDERSQLDSELEKTLTEMNK